MRSSRMRILSLLVLSSVLLSGCGTKMYELEPEEEALIASYSAKVVAKYNKCQKDGQVSIAEEVESTEEVTQEQEAPQEQETPQEGQMDTASDTDELSMALEEQEDACTLNQALDLGVVEALYEGCELTDTYQDELCSLEAEEGKTYMVLKIALKNTVAQELHIDILSLTPSFVLETEGKNIPSETTILLNDLSTYQSNIAPNGTNQTVLLYQVPKDTKKPAELKLKITMSGKTNIVTL